MQQVVNLHINKLDSMEQQQVRQLIDEFIERNPLERSTIEGRTL